MNEAVCDNASVGVIARDGQGRILLIERKKTPFGWAPPSGHCDGLTYPVACFIEFEEETGLKVIGAPRPITPKNSRKYFKCRRGGQYHDWQIFEVNWCGELRLSQYETKNANWCSAEEIKALAVKTSLYLLKIEEIKSLQEEMARAFRKVIEGDWQTNPGLEPVWYEFFKELKII